MDITVQRAIGSCRSLEQQLSQQLAANNVSYAQLDDTLNQICSACSTALLVDYEAASAHHAEDRLWDSHQKVNQYYRAALAKLKNSKEPTTVARRKLESSYLRFIKGSQRFYRGYIRDLSVAHGGIVELERVARKVTSSSDGQKEAKHTTSAAPNDHILVSCHTTLIHLGDLSRYRETELCGKERNWGPAVGFYDLATSILPTSGLSYNQLAVIALADGSLFRATYQLYRSLSAEEPHPNIEQNLRRAFSKISTAWKTGDLSTNPTMTGGAGLPSSMVAWYLRLLSLYFHGKTFAEREELENEVINQLEVDLRKRPSQSSPHRLFTINIAAGHAAEERLLKSDVMTEDVMQSYLYFLRLNIRMCLSLLRILYADIADLEPLNGSDAEQSPKSLAERLGPGTKRILPALHLYSLWLHKNISVLANSVDPSLSAYQTELWAVYANCLSLMTRTFPPEKLQTVDYLLEEEEETIGFKPLHCNENRETWYAADAPKPKWHDMTEQSRDLASEMLSRVTTFVVIGLKLSVKPDTPISLDQSTCTFIYQSSASRSEEVASVASGIISSEMSARANAPDASSPSHTLRDVDDAISLEDLEAQRMVDSIVGPDDFLDDSTLSLLAPTNMTENRHSTQSQTKKGQAKSSSTFPVGTHTAHDLLEAVQNYSQNQRRPNAPRTSVSAFPGLEMRTNSSSALQSPAVAGPMLSPGLFTERTRTPQARSLSRPATATRTSPLAPPPGLGHSRINSNDSNWMPDDIWTSYQPSGTSGLPESTRTGAHRRSLYSERALGNGTFGDILSRRVSTHDESNMNSPSLPAGTSHEGWGLTSASFGRAGKLDSPLQAPFEGSPWGVNASGPQTPVNRSMSHAFNTFAQPLT